MRRRFLELDRREDARAAESAWISTIHGFCARILRAHALSAGIDPDFRVLDELEAERIAADAFDGALEEFMGEGDPATGSRWWPPTRPTGCGDMVRTAYSHLRSRGERHPRLEETLPPQPSGEARPARGSRPGGAGRAGAVGAAERRERSSAGDRDGIEARRPAR